MAQKKKKNNPAEFPGPQKEPEVIPVADPEEPLQTPETDPDIIPTEDPDETTPPYEVPPPGEGP